MKRVISAILAAILALSLLPAFQIETKAEEQDLYALVEQQIRAYAKSIDQPDAVSAAASSLAVHGMTMGGKKLTMNGQNALTAVLMNSELMRNAMTETCAAAIDHMQKLDLSSLPYIRGNYSWDSQSQFYGARLFTAAGWNYENLERRLVPTVSDLRYNGEYDSALEWMAGIVFANISIQQTQITENTVTYVVNCAFHDRFDFSLSSNSGFKNLISGVGAILFREFDWEAKVTFELTVPYSCSHKSGAYHWTYNPDTKMMYSDSADGYQENSVVRHTYLTGEENDKYYFELAETVRLYHDKPWVMEYQISNPGYLVFAPLESVETIHPYLRQTANSSLFAIRKQFVQLSESEADDLKLENLTWSRMHYYGTQLKSLFDYSRSGLYTFRLENVPKSDGTNMVWLTVYSHSLKQTVFYAPMDDYSTKASWNEEVILQSTESTGISGMDFLINYIGAKIYCFSAGFFDLKIWENGQEGAEESYITSTRVAPTCTAEGYTLHTCSKCGYSYKTDYTEKLPHDYKETLVFPTCTTEGYTSYKCTDCGDCYQADAVAKLPHSVAEYIPNNDATCSHDGTKTGKCAVCGYLDIVPDVGTQLPHAWADATCLKPQTCKSCGITEGLALGHALWYANGKEPTCTEVGWAAYEKCSRCKYSTFQQIPALGHNFVNNRCAHCGLWDGPIQPGDVNGDGEIDTTDAYLIVMYYNEMLDLTEEQLLAADVNGDGEIDTTDAYYIVLFYNEMIDQFPAI